ncbi:MAG TPA: nitroreductase family protein [bacterium]|nr:nitroreductase family protein [bacterium]
MSGIVFMKTRMLPELRRFYIETLGCSLWLDQGGCTLFRHGNFIVGFCGADTAEIQGILTFFYPSSADVDAMYEIMKASADGPPRRNDRYRIYQFFARDPEGRTLEFQYFLHPVHEHLTGRELLMQRRSVRQFTGDPVPEPLLQRILDVCRYSPTSMNSKSYFFKPVPEPDDLAWLAATRGDASAPLGRAPMAMAIGADPEKTKRPDQDGDIAAYHFMLAARHYGLGTCWIAALNRDDVKERLNIPRHYTIATITPVGWPGE